MSTKGSKLQVEKVYDNSTSFKETIKFTLLHCNNFDGNNNKFYIIEIQKNDKDEYQLFSNYGRLGKTSVYEIRKYFKGSTDPIINLSDIESEYDAIISKKERGKNVKGVKESYSKVAVISPTVGSSNVFNSSDVSIDNSIDIDIGDHAEVMRIIEQLKNDNIHDILSKTSLKLTSRGLETDIGIVTESHINKAEDVLDELRTFIVDKDDDGITSTNNKYFSLIPKKFGNRLDKSDMIKDADKLAETYELLDNLKTALKTTVAPKDEKSKVKIDISYLEDKDEWERLSKFFESNKHKSHSHLNNWKIKNIFNYGESNHNLENYEKMYEMMDNEFELFHGSRNTNILSILLNGFMIPPATAGHCNGRMFGPGIYHASCSTKALNYSTGFWDGKGDDKNAFIFITRVIMGNIERCKHFKYSGIGTDYDSILGLTEKDGGSLLNEEYIVNDLAQVKITHLIELQK